MRFRPFFIFGLLYVLVFSVFGSVQISDFNKDFVRVNIDVDNKTQYNDSLLVMLSDGGRTQRVCYEKVLSNDSSAAYVSKICNLDINEPGTYRVDVYLMREGRRVGHYSLNRSFFISVKKNDTMIRCSYRNKTAFFDVYVNVTSEDNHIVKIFIPKSIMKSYSDEVFSSSLPYKVLVKDPLIAWDVDKLPRHVDFQVKTETPPTKDDLNDMTVTVEDKRFFTKYLFIVLLILLVGFIVFQIFWRNFNKRTK